MYARYIKALIRAGFTNRQSRQLPRAALSRGRHSREIKIKIVHNNYKFKLSVLFYFYRGDFFLNIYGTFILAHWKNYFNTIVVTKTYTFAAQSEHGLDDFSLCLYVYWRLINTLTQPSFISQQSQNFTLLIEHFYLVALIALQ